MANVREMRDYYAVTHSCPAWEMRRGRGDLVSIHSLGYLGAHLLPVPSAPSKAMATKLVLAQSYRVKSRAGVFCTEQENDLNQWFSSFCALQTTQTPAFRDLHWLHRFISP